MSRRTRLLYCFIVGPLILLGGVYDWLSQGLSFYSLWYFLIGGTLVAFGLRYLLTDIPDRTWEDPLLLLARPYALAIMLLIGGVGFVISTASPYMPWPDSLLRFVAYAAFFVLLFLYARHVKRTPAAGTRAITR